MEKGNKNKVQVRLLRDGDPLIAFTRLQYANTTICSSSTFCFYAALANNGTNVFFPKTHLIARPERTNGSVYSYGDHFHWIDEPQILDAWKQSLEELLANLEGTNTNKDHKEDL